MNNQSELSLVLRRFHGVFWAIGAFSLAINVLLLVPSLYMLQVYDRVLSSRNMTTLLMLSLIMLGLFALESALEFVRSRVLVRMSVALDVALAPRLFDVSFERYLQSGSGSQALADLTQLRQFMTSQGVFAFFDAPWMPIYLGVVFIISPWMGVFALAGALILTLMAYLTERFTAPALAGAAREAALANAYAAANLRNAEAVHAMGMLSRLRERWFGRQAAFLTLQAQASDRAAAISALTRFFRLTMQSGILGLGAYLVLENQITAGGMIAGSILLGRALAPVELGISTWRGFVAARGARQRLRELLAAHPPRPESLPLPRPKGEVQAESLEVAAPGRRETILKGLNFRAPAGAVVAVIGPSGSGKSTLARTLVGIWKAQSGAMRLDGADVYAWNKSELGAWVGYLPQSVELMEGTLAENIARFGVLDTDGILQAAQRAGVHELIQHLPQGYDTRIGEGGLVLSGGQRQRIGLARALYGDPSLIVLDEPNANLDEAGDAALQKALRELKERQRTLFVITHRQNVLALADYVLVLVDGAVQAYGPREQVFNAMKARMAPASAPVPRV